MKDKTKKGKTKKNLDQLLSYKKGNGGPAIDSTAQIDVYRLRKIGMPKR